MDPARDIARELLPYVVMIWATFALLGGALEHTQSAVDDDGRTIAESGLGLCAVTVACVVGGTMARLRPRSWRVFRFARSLPVLQVFREPLVYHRPPSPPSLARLQILRT